MVTYALFHITRTHSPLPTISIGLFFCSGLGVLRHIVWKKNGFSYNKRIPHRRWVNFISIHWRRIESNRLLVTTAHELNGMEWCPRNHTFMWISTFVETIWLTAFSQQIIFSKCWIVYVRSLKRSRTLERSVPLDETSWSARTGWHSCRQHLVCQCKIDSMREHYDGLHSTWALSICR